MPVTIQDLPEILIQHIQWLDSNGIRGVRANLEGANLEGANLENANLRFANLENANLEGANLENADLLRANLEGANLRGATLLRATLENADLWCANLEGADLWRANLEGANLENANLRGANLENANLRGANLENANLENANLRGATLEGANLEGANLENANLRFANLEGANLRGANLEGANLEGANLRGATLLRADLEGANLQGANLEGADLWRVNLEGANLENADLLRANLRFANLEGANLRGANLEGADLRGANLRGANLEGANLEGANLWCANLQGVNLRGANLENADLEGVNLEGANLRFVNLEGAIGHVENPFTLINTTGLSFEALGETTQEQIERLERSIRNCNDEPCIYCDPVREKIGNLKAFLVPSRNSYPWEHGQVDIDLLYKYNKSLTNLELDSDLWQQVRSHMLSNNLSRPYFRDYTGNLRSDSLYYPIYVASQDGQSIHCSSSASLGNEIAIRNIEPEYAQYIAYNFRLAGRDVPLVWDVDTTNFIPHPRKTISPKNPIKAKVSVSTSEITSTKVKAATAVEKIVEEGLIELLNLEEKSLPITRVRKIIDRVTAIDSTYGREFSKGSVCIICKSDRRTGQELCPGCLSILKDTQDSPGIFAPSREREIETMESIAQDMLSDGVLDYSTRVPCESAQPMDMGVEIELEYVGMSTHNECSHGCDSDCEEFSGWDVTDENGDPTDESEAQYENHCSHDCDDDGCNNHTFGSFIPTFVSEFQGDAIIKHDGSLNNGVEFVTRPMGRDELESVVSRYGPFSYSYKFRAQDSCGMHIHVNRAGFSGDAHQLRFGEFIRTEIDTDFIEQYVGTRRYSRQIDNSGSGYATNEESFMLRHVVNTTVARPIIGHNRYRMVSFVPNNTLEVRFFASSTNPEKLRSNIQLVVAVREYTRHAFMPTWEEFCQYAKKRHKKYKDLVDRINRFVATEEMELV